jgi:XTP/dITP diphosphohydrolase
MTDILLATKNRKKVDELCALLAESPVRVVSLLDFPDFPDTPETGCTFAENAELKARAAAQTLGIISLADDSGLEVDALDGAPGVLSNRFAGPQATDRDKCLRILELMADVPDEKRTARFRAAIAIATPAGEVSIVEGVCEGLIRREMRGENGFGYDPIFYLPSRGKTMAQLTQEEKNAISHRGKALLASKEILGSLIHTENA